jgi:solute carrier family 38 (sodium-coupled neutral amino acid transporter), member 11
VAGSHDGACVPHSLLACGVPSILLLVITQELDLDRQATLSGNFLSSDNVPIIANMAKARQHGNHRDDANSRSNRGGNEEDRGLLEDHSSGDEAEETGLVTAQHSKFEPQTPRTPRTPRTPNRVRFDLRPSILDDPASGENGASRDRRASLEYDESLQSPATQHRLPLLTNIEAPSIALANSSWSDEDVPEWIEEERRRPKSGLWSAFMNMANSIIGAGIIGQPYAFKQAGLLAGIILLVGLTVVVDWTIRLIVINSKLSGSNSFQGTVEHCFGKTGLIAISVAQWAFAFGGMVAFGVIVGDSIPHVFLAIWPNLRDMPVFGLLADRRVVIVIFILGISYPLTLYRDIAKVSKSQKKKKKFATQYETALIR